MSGLFTPADIARFSEAREAAIARLRCARNRQRTLVDIRGMKIQPRDMVEAFATVIDQPALRSERLAFVVERTLARSQLLRAAASRDARVFRDPDEALRWLLTGEDAAADGGD